LAACILVFGAKGDFCIATENTESTEWKMTKDWKPGKGEKETIYAYLSNY
jgi:hypothetical protein